MVQRLAKTLLLGGGLLAISAAEAGAWLAPGDVAMRHDLQLLADAGIIQAPLSTWPLSWDDLASDLTQEPVELFMQPFLAAAWGRVVAAYRDTLTTKIRPQIRMSADSDVRELRSFASTPREEAEIALGLAANRGAASYRLELTAVESPADGDQYRWDNSYVAGLAGNWSVSAGAVERWWGPGWEGSLIWSNNARPIPAVTVQRNDSAPFTWRGLRWLGPWQVLLSVGQLEPERSDVPDAMFMGMRFNFKPTPALEFGMSRTAQWGGEGRSEGWGTFRDLLLGHDNVGNDGVSGSNQPGNQLAGFDARWVSPLMTLPYALYFQAIGEDEAGNMPSKYFALGGLELWGGSANTAYRWHVEYADTAVIFYKDTPLFGVVYQHSLYTQGYTYHERTIGHALGGDGRMLSIGMLVVAAQGGSAELILRQLEPNRNQLNLKMQALEANFQADWSRNRFHLRLALLHRRDQQAGLRDTDTQLGLQWQREFW